MNVCHEREEQSDLVSNDIIDSETMSNRKLTFELEPVHEER